MSQNNIYRKIALDRLSSPEELDQRLTIVSPIGWVSLIAVALLICAGLTWGFLGSIADKAAGTGIIISSGGINGVIHRADGQITDISVHDGDYVEKGQVIARIEQTELIEKINQYKEDLAAAQSIDLENLQMNNSKLNFNIYGKIGEIFADYENAIANLTAQRVSSYTQSDQSKYALEQTRIKYEDSLEKYNNYKALYENGAVSQNELNNAESEFRINEAAYNSQRQNLNAMSQAQLNQVEANLRAQKQWLKDTIAVSIIDLQNNIAKMQRDLLNNGDIIANVSGRVLEMQVKKGDIVKAGSVVCTIAEEKTQTDSLEAVIYVPVGNGKKIKPGMEVNVSPSTVKKEENGFMLGNVVSVSEYPTSAQGMMLTLGNTELVKQLSAQGASLEVKVKLVMDSSTRSGYKWSSPQGPPIGIDGGTFCIGEVKVNQKRPISMVLPYIKEHLPI
ncbi:MAG: NHLP bacteriocin system secretion protein [Syntrophomonas sp.]|nr:NHLP bacteriocin system secretion protein [Syntrophomonas sp.]